MIYQREEHKAERMELCLDNIKQEKDDFNSYGSYMSVEEDGNYGNYISDGDGSKVIDSFVAGNDYNDDYQLAVPSADEGVGDGVDVDWLSSFFDDGDPLNQCRSALDQDNMDSLNACNSLMNTNADSFSPNQCSKGNSINNDTFLDSFSTFSEDFINGTSSMATCDAELSLGQAGKTLSPNSLKRAAPNSPSLRHNNPLLSQADQETNLKRQIKITDVKIEPLQSSVDMGLDQLPSSTATGTMSSSSSSGKHQLVPVQVQQKQNQQKLLLFMNTPENRAKLAGTNYNIINANILSKLQAPQANAQVTNAASNNSPLNKPAATIGSSSYGASATVNPANNLLNLKNCIKVGNTIIKQEPDSPSRHPTPAQHSGQLMLNRPADMNAYSTDRNGNRLLMKRDQRLSSGSLSPPSMSTNNIYATTENSDSGYDSASQSSNSSPGSPQIDVESHDDRNFLETIQHIDIPPSERQPFFLSPEERRTLIVEGLPVPSGLPLSKSEERALKKVRRKIKNKISAQESRRKKKEYMECLEKKVEIFASENSSLKKKMASLEVANRSLIMQVQKLQALVNNQQTQKNSLQLKQHNTRTIEPDAKD